MTAPDHHRRFRNATRRSAALLLIHDRRARRAPVLAATAETASAARACLASHWHPPASENFKILQPCRKLTVYLFARNGMWVNAAAIHLMQLRRGDHLPGEVKTYNRQV
jgi:transcription termination factor Rho